MGICELDGVTLGEMIRKNPRGGSAAGGPGGGGVGGAVGPSVKEPASRKASGLAHLITNLHQNAAAVVNSKTQLNGPDQVGLRYRPATCLCRLCL